MQEKAKILIVDDKVGNLVTLEKLLSTFPVTIVRALSGNEALQQTLNHRFALALIDVQMPEMDGYETVSFMRSSQETRFLPIIFVSAIYREDFHVVKGIESGAVDFIAKPINPEILKGKVKIFLELHEQKANLEEEINKRRLIQQQLSQGNALLKSFLHSIPDLVFYKDSIGRYINCNSSFAEFTGYSIDDIIGKTDHELFPEKIANEYSRSDKEVIDKKKAIIIEHWDTLPSGKRALFETHKNPIFDSHGIFIGSIGISRNITQKHFDKVELQKAKDDAEAANMAKSMFLANMSHEIRTPMNGIIGMTDILQQTKLSSEQQEFLRIISLSGNNLLTIINDILDYSEIESGGIVLEQIDFRLNDPFDETIKLLNYKAQQKNISLDLTMNDDLPEFVNGDSLRTKQIIINLVNNAIKFTEKGGVMISAELLEDSRNKVKVLFKITDTGIGISEEGKQRLFKAFSQTDASTTRKFGGTGLGLTISKRLVELMGGEIGVDSDTGVGSTFWFSISYNKASSAGAIDPNVSDTKSRVNDTIKILLVEDNPINQRVAVYNLKKLGHYVDIAENGFEAVELFNQKSYNLVLMDIQMPVMDGMEATQKIRKLERKNKANRIIPIIAMTANAMKGDRERFIKYGFTDYISKPFKKIDLEQVLKLT
ncbi:MAG: response regulator [Bacteroidetes bacterium]|nr:response regulator [Bacteroidota bacterium]